MKHFFSLLEVNIKCIVISQNVENHHFIQSMFSRRYQTWICFRSMLVSYLSNVPHKHFFGGLRWYFLHPEIVDQKSLRRDFFKTFFGNFYFLNRDALARLSWNAQQIVAGISLSFLVYRESSFQAHHDEFIRTWRNVIYLEYRISHLLRKRLLNAALNKKW